MIIYALSTHAKLWDKASTKLFLNEEEAKTEALRQRKAFLFDIANGETDSEWFSNLDEADKAEGIIEFNEHDDGMNQWIQKINL